MTEIQLQSQCFQWAWNEHPQTRRLLFHVPNGGKRNKIEAMQLKASGVVAGVPDLLFLWRGRWYAFEMKEEAGTLSPAQKELHPVWLSHNQPIWVVRDFETFKYLFVQIININ